MKPVVKQHCRPVVGFLLVGWCPATPDQENAMADLLLTNRAMTKMSQVSL